MKIWFGALALLAACNANNGDGIITVDDSVSADEDSDAPVITCTIIEGSQPIGDDVPVTCNATDAVSGVFLVQVHFKQETSVTWDDATLQQVDAAGNYEGQIPGKKVASAGIDYYFSATDGSDNEGTMPEDGEADPYHFRVSE